MPANGSASITVNKGSTYTDAGATASDNIDGDITSNITSTSNININVAGSYTVTYNVADKLGNQAASVIRTVNVVIPTYANAPALTSGMTPIKWNGSAWVDTTESDTSWYNYDTTNKQWANARTADGSMWVWIPRYIYKISSGWHTATSGTIGVQFTKGTNDNWNSSVIGNINTDTTANASNGTWTNHPAFTFGSTELTGIWVAKFEASSSNPAATNGGGNVTTLKAKSLPNVVSWRGITVGNIFTVTRSMETDNTYGWGTTGTGIDTHLIKNVEWGAVAYLAQSAYGKNGQVAANSSSNYYTGGGISNAYVTNIVQSTTGNIYGIYDMSGGTFEFTAAFLDDEFASDYGASIASAADKYYDAYSGISDDPASLNYNHALYKKGDAIYETSASVDYYGAWYGEIAGMPYYYYPWFVRSSVFGFAEAEGWEAYNFGFRPVLLVNTGL
jgi:hypothetical protein